MPYLSPERRAEGGRVFTSRADDPHDGGPCDCDWTTPKSLAELRHRVLPTPDQTRYGRARRDTPR